MLFVGLLAPACVPTARGFGVYESKAAQTAEKAGSTVQSALLLVELVAQRRTFSPYVSAGAHDAEAEASAIETTFAGIQPPDGRSQRIRTELDAMLHSAVSVLGEVRVAAIRGDRAGLLAQAGALRAAARDLNAFAKRHR